jgi:hypothetical protein
MKKKFLNICGGVGINRYGANRTTVVNVNHPAQTMAELSITSKFLRVGLLNIQGSKHAKTVKVHVRIEEKILLYRCQILALGGGFHYRFQFVVRMEDRGFSTGSKAHHHNGSLGSGHHDICPDAVSLVVAQIP